MNELRDHIEEIRKKHYSTKEEMKENQIRMARRMYEKFMSSLIDMIEKSVIEKQKVVRLPISKRDDISKLRHLIKKIAKNLGFNVKSVKKRWVIVENTKFIVEKISKVKYAIEETTGVKKSEVKSNM